MLPADFPDNVYAIQHLGFEDLGAWEDVLYSLGLRVRYVEAGVEDLTRALTHKGLTVILGGPIAVYDTQDYPFLNQEIELLTQRLADDLPTLGICLGAQLIAHALGSQVYAGEHKEIGWSKLSLADVENNPLQALKDTEVLHWHGDSFELPENATLLASSAMYPQQAFAYGKHVLGLQFHAEVASDALEKWLIGHSCELRHAKINIANLRKDNQRYAAHLEPAAQQVLLQFLQQL